MFGERCTRGLIIVALCGLKVVAEAGPGPRTVMPDPQGRFIENRNQWPSEVDFSARIPGGNIFIQPGLWKFMVIDREQVESRHLLAHHSFTESGTTTKEDPCIEGRNIELIFERANRSSIPHPFGQGSTLYNFFFGSDPHRWGTSARAYEGILYSEIYQGIDLKIRHDNSALKYDFIVAPGADPSQISMAYDGIDEMWIESGAVEMKAGFLTLTDQRPVAYQVQSNGNTRTIPCKYHVDGKRLGFEFPSGYDQCQPLIIDPLLIFSTYSGSTADNWGSTATPAENGRLYSAGVTSEYVGGTFPATSGAFQTAYGGLFDIAILKYDSAGENALYASYLGGAACESPHSLVVNNQNELIVLGTTSSPNFPTTVNAYDRSFNGGTPDYNVFSYDNGSDIVVAKISPDGSHLLASTFIGGSLNDGLNPSGGILVRNYGDQLRGDIVTDSQGNIFISSVTGSSDFPAINSFSTVYKGGPTDALVMELTPALSQITWSAFIGGSEADASHTIKLDQAGNIFLAGGTASYNFPVTVGTYQTNHAGSADGWIGHISGNGGGIMSSTFTGTTGLDQVYFIDLNSQEEVYVYGQTNGAMPVTAGVYSNPNSGQFIQKFSNDLETLVFSTVFGSGSGIPNISPTAFMVNDCNNLYATGWGGVLNQLEGYWPSNTYGMPVSSNAYQATTHGSDFYFIVLTDDATRFLYGTFMGGPNSRTHVDGGTSRFDKKGVVYHAVCSGCAAANATGHQTSDFPTTTNAHSRVNRSQNCNNAAFKFDLSSLHAIVQTNNVHLSLPGYRSVCIPDGIVFQNLSTGGQIFQWDLGDGTALSKADTSLVFHKYKNPGTYTVKLKAIDASTCIGKDSTFTTVDVHIPQGDASGDATICHGGTTTLTATGGVSYSWVSSDGSQTSSSANFVVSPTDTTSYRVTITDANGCITKDTVDIKVVPGIDLKFEAAKQYEDCFSRPSLAVKNLTDPKEEVFFDFGDGSTSDNSQDTHQYQDDGTYAVRLVGKKEFCVYDKRQDVAIYELQVPNVITPSSSPGQNDKFVIHYGGHTLADMALHANVSIYNRWGQTVFHSNDYLDDWAGENVAGGVYFFEVEIIGETSCKGWVQVVK